MGKIDLFIRLSAWFVVIMHALETAFYPCLWGKQRTPWPERYGAVTWTGHVISMALLIPICGRILGWW